MRADRQCRRAESRVARAINADIGREDGGAFRECHRASGHAAAARDRSGERHRLTEVDGFGDEVKVVVVAPRTTWTTQLLTWNGQVRMRYPYVDPGVTALSVYEAWPLRRFPRRRRRSRRPPAPRRSSLQAARWAR